MIIAFTGTPGAGKTTLAKKFAQKHGYRYIDVNIFAKEAEITDGYDKNMQCFIVDVERLQKVLQPELKGNVVVDSHLSHYLPYENLDLVIVVECSDLKELEKRLKKRDYSEEKIRENLDCEIFKVCEIDAQEKGHIVKVVDTSKKSEDECLEEIEQAVNPEVSSVG